MQKYTIVVFRSYKERQFDPNVLETDIKSVFDKFVENAFNSFFDTACYLVDNTTGRLIDSYIK